MLAVALVLGAFIPSLLGISASASLFAAIGCDVVIGFVAGILTLGVIVPSGLAGGELSYWLRQIRWIGDDRANRFRLSLQAEWSRRDALRFVVLALAGVLVSAGVTQLFSAAPSPTAPRGRADTAPAVPSAWTIVLPLVSWFLATGLVWLTFGRVGKRGGAKGAQTHEPESPSTHHLRRATHVNAMAVGLTIVIGWLAALEMD